MTNIHVAYSDSDRGASRPAARSPRDVSSLSAATEQPESYQDPAYAVAGRREQARVIGELARTAFGRIGKTLRAVWSGYRQRRAERRTLVTLLSLDDHMLRDIGLDRYQLAEQVHARLATTREPASVIDLVARRRDHKPEQPTHRAA